MIEQITLEEVLELVSFEKVNGEWLVQKVMGDVEGRSVAMGVTTLCGSAPKARANLRAQARLMDRL